MGNIHFTDPRPDGVDADMSANIGRPRITPAGMVSRRDAAMTLLRQPKTLAEWSLRGVGPRPVMVGGRCFYRWAEVIAIARGEKPVAAWADAA